MNSKAILAIAAFAAFSSAATRADDITVDNTVLQSNRTRAEVMAEAATVASTRGFEPGSRAAAPLQSTLDAKAVRAEAAQAVRLGQIPHGEASQI